METPYESLRIVERVLDKLLELFISFLLLVGRSVEGWRMARGKKKRTLRERPLRDRQSRRLSKSNKDKPPLRGNLQG